MISQQELSEWPNVKSMHSALSVGKSEIYIIRQRLALCKTSGRQHRGFPTLAWDSHRFGDPRKPGGALVPGLGAEANPVTLHDPGGGGALQAQGWGLQMMT